MPWPTWLDEVSAKLAENDKTCLDCGVLIDGEYVYPTFSGDGCDHADPLCAECGTPSRERWVQFSGSSFITTCSLDCARKAGHAAD